MNIANSIQPKNIQKKKLVLIHWPTNLNYIVGEGIFYIKQRLNHRNKNNNIISYIKSLGESLPFMGAMVGLVIFMYLSDNKGTNKI